MWISDESWKKQGTKKGCAILETFSSDGPSEFLVVTGTRCNEHQRRLNAQREELRSVRLAAKFVSFNEWKTVASGPGRAACCLELVGKKGDSGSGRLPGKCADIKVDTEALERMMEPEEVEVCLWCILKYATRRCSNIF